MRTPSDLFGNISQEERDRFNAAMEHTEAAEIDEENRHTHYTAYCGKIVARVGVDGKLYHIRWKCGNWHECPTCRAERIVHTKERMKYILTDLDEGLDLVQITVARQSQAEAIGRIIADKEKYIRIPLNGKITIYATVSNAKRKKLARFMPSTVTSFDDIDEEGWESMAITPKGYRTTGKLGLAAGAEEKVAEGVTVIVADVLYIHTDASSSDRREAFNEAVEKTPEIPETPEDIPGLMRKRTLAYEEALESRNCEAYLLHQRRKLHIHIDSIKNWLHSANMYGLFGNSLTGDYQ